MTKTTVHQQPQREAALQRFARQHPRINTAIILLGLMASLSLVVRSLMGHSHWLIGVTAALVSLLNCLQFWVARTQKKK